MENEAINQLLATGGPVALVCATALIATVLVLRHLRTSSTK